VLLAESQSALGRFDQAIHLYLNGIEWSPLAEEFYQRLLECYLRIGDFSKGVSCYLKCRDALERNLDTVPSARTEQLYLELRKKAG